jgi:hypothetical protein
MGARMSKAWWVGLLTGALALSAACPAVAAKPGLFDETGPLQLTITAPFPALVKASAGATPPYSATVSVSQGAAPAQTIALELRARGATRRTGGYCNFPPLSFGFDKAAVKGTVFHGQGRLKLVTYCRTPADYEQRAVLEYLAYRMYNLITPLSFRVRGADITYRSSGADKGVTRFGFLIETVDDMARRNGRAELKALTQQVSSTQLAARPQARAALFQLMISNLDWEFLASHAGEPCCHNVKLIGAPKAAPATASGVIPVPYDFDYSGLVDAPYAKPPEGLEAVSTVTDRFYRGYCAPAAEVNAAADEFRAHKGEILSLVRDETRLSEANRTKAARFLEGFFAILDDPALFERKVLKRCRS